MLLVCTIVLSAIVVLLSWWKHDGATLRWLVLGCLAWASILVFLWYSMAPRLAIGGLDRAVWMERDEQVLAVATGCSAHGTTFLAAMWVTCATLAIVAWLSSRSRLTVLPRQAHRDP